MSFLTQLLPVRVSRLLKFQVLEGVIHLFCFFKSSDYTFNSLLNQAKRNFNEIFQDKNCI